MTDSGETDEFVLPSTLLAGDEALDLLDRFVARTPVGLVAFDATGAIEFCDDSFADLVDARPGDLVGIDAGEILSGVDGGSSLAASVAEGTLDGRIPLETTAGTTVDAQATFVTCRDGGVLGLVVDGYTHRDGELADYRSLVESAGDPMYALDASGTVQVANEAMAEFVGEPRESLLGTHIGDLLPARAVEEGEIALRLARENDERDWESFETWLTDARGRERLVEATIGPTAADDGASVVVTLRDVTERHRREEELDLIKRIFSRSLRHNIRNKASVIESFATLLAEDLEGEHAEMAEAILRASNSLAQTSEKVSDLDWVVETDFDVVEHDLCPLLRDAIAEVADTNPDATIEFDVEETVPVEGIRDLQYAFENLVENALEHGVSGGPPTVTVEVEVRARTVRVVVADDGPGIPKSEVRVIEAGEETELEHGSGLGLWLVDQVVEQSGGSLSFVVDDGTEAHVELRRADTDE